MNHSTGLKASPLVARGVKSFSYLAGQAMLDEIVRLDRTAVKLGKSFKN